MELRNYKFVRNMADNRIPSYPYTLVNTTYGIYFSQGVYLYRTDDEGLTVDTIETRTYAIQAIWYDRSNERIYCHSVTNSQANHECFYITLSTGVATEMGSFTTTAFLYQVGKDIFPIGSDWYVTSTERITTNDWLQVRKWSGSAWNVDIQAVPVSGQKVPRSTPVAIVGTDAYFLVKNTNVNFDVFIYKFDSTVPSLTKLWTTTIYDLPVQRQFGAIYNDDDDIYFVLKKDADSKYYLQKWSITSASITEIGEYDITWQLNRNTISTVMEHAFDATGRKIYQLHENRNQLNFISNMENIASGTIYGITEEYFIIYDSVSELWKWEDASDDIIEAMYYHSRQDYSYLKMKFNSDLITIEPQMFIQLIGSYTADGSTTSDQVIFEGVAEAPTEGRIQYVLIKNQGYEMDEVKPDGSKAGNSDAIITDINNDGAPNGPEYIQDGTLASGSAMGTIVFNKSKTLRKVYNDLTEHDGFTWYLRNQGALDYNAGGVDSGADLRYDGSGYTDTILQVKAWKISKINQIIVNGGIELTGGLYSGKWDDLIDQATNGINSITIEDATLNSDALCQTKADNMGAGETERTRARFKFRKTTYGFIQPGQTITFKYDITNYMTIPEAQFILDKIIMNIKSGVGYAEISSEL